jgi:hypothetical protein
MGTGWVPSAMYGALKTCSMCEAGLMPMYLGPEVSSRLTRALGGAAYFWPSALACSWMSACFWCCQNGALLRDSFAMAYKLLVQGDLLQRHAVDLGIRRAQQRTCCEEHRRLHDCGRWDVQIDLNGGR